MSNREGKLSIHSENIFPIIKKWLYSDQDIFLREVVSNASDAITKLNKLEIMGEYQYPDQHQHKIQIELNDQAKTLKITDTGLGMTSEEVEQYINQIAFSGATDFINKYKDKSNDEQIIGHFGLGFYSTFMVADKVTIDTLSYQAGSSPVHWECDGGTEYQMSDGSKTEIGTTITLHLNPDCLEYCNEYRVREVLQKYCSFMPVNIYLSKENAEVAYEEIPIEDILETDEVVERFTKEAITKEVEGEDGTKTLEEITPAKEMAKIIKRPVPINDPSPLWMKNPSECSEDEYLSFYRKVFNDYKAPLFWIHLNMDYPYNLKGILYFPKLNTQYDKLEGTIKLFNNQVFVAENIKEVIPEFLLLLNGVIDCPDLPLNVSRSALQNDGFVGKISDYITKKVADKLNGLRKTERENYEKYWDDISPFIKYGYIKDPKFSEKIENSILVKNLDNKYLSLEELFKDLPEIKEDEENPKKESFYYVSDEQGQSQYIRLFKEEGKIAYYLNDVIDTTFISVLEQHKPNVEFLRVDSQIDEDMLSSKEDLQESQTTLEEIFKKALGKENFKVEVKALKSEETASIIVLSEQGHRMAEMMKAYGMGNSMNLYEMSDQSLVLNINHPLVKYLLEAKESQYTDLFAKQLYDLALLAHHPLSAEEMNDFIQRSHQIMLALKG